MSNVIGVSGHRPPKLGGYSDDLLVMLGGFCYEVMAQIKPDAVNLGMALGFDTAMAMGCLEAKIPYRAFIPCRDQESRWPQSSQARYRNLLATAEEVTWVSNLQYTEGCMTARNQRMIDVSTEALVLWDGSRGGTCDFVIKTKIAGMPHRNLWSDWLAYQEMYL